MNRRKVLGYVLVAFAAIAMSSIDAGEPNKYPPCYTVRESKLRGCFVRSVSVNPNAIRWNGKDIVIKEAWVEKCLERGQLLGPVIGRPFAKTVDGYHLCINLSKGWDVLWNITDRPPFFVIEGGGRGLGMMGSCVLWDDVERVESAKCTLLLTDNWKFENAQKFKVSLDAKGK